MKVSDFSINEFTDKLQSGQMTRRKFNKLLGAAGISLVMAPMLSRTATAAAADQATYFTWGGYDVPEMFGSYIVAAPGEIGCLVCGRRCRGA